MKIEKINEKQIKILLTQEDLEERNLNFNEFASGSEKAQILFKDLMEMASQECGFDVDANKFIIEAKILSIDSILLIVTKVSNTEDLLERFEAYKNIRANICDRYNPKANSIPVIENENICVYSFDSLDAICDVATRLDSEYDSKSSLFKYKDIYYLVMDTCDEENISYITSILNEYGDKQNASELSTYFFIEHGEIIIKDTAVHTLSMI